MTIIRFLVPFVLLLSAPSWACVGATDGSCRASCPSADQATPKPVATSGSVGALVRVLKLAPKSAHAVSRSVAPKQRPKTQAPTPSPDPSRP